VLVLEAAATTGHERSGSKGDARIFRLGYPEPHYVDLALLARARWHQLEAETGRQLLHVTGQVTMGDEATQQAIAAALTAAGAAVEEISSPAAARRFPGIVSSGPVLVEPDSGVLAADECLRALHQAGAYELRTGTLVTSLRQ
jgi:sarcosine oxidase